MIVVTAPTGAIGTQVLQRLLAAAPVRVIARDPSRLSPAVRGRVEVVPGSHGDPDVVGKAFAGADVVFWLPPPNPATTSLEASIVDFTRPAAEAFAAQGVARVVGISALGRGTPQEPNSGQVHASLRMDDLIAGSGAAYRALTMPSFMDNLLRSVASIRDAGVFFGVNAGDRAVPTCATRDIADVAAGLLLDGTWTGVAEVPVLGPEDLSPDDEAAIMTEVLGRPVRYQRIEPEAFRAAMLGVGASEAWAQGLVDMAVAKANGLDNAEPRTPQSSTPTSFRQWCEDVLRPAVRS